MLPAIIREASVQRREMLNMTAVRPENLLRKIRRKVREVGPVYAVQRAFYRIVPAWLFRCNFLVVVAAELASGSQTPRRDPAVRWGSDVDLPEIVRIGFNLKQCRSWLDNGARFAVFEHGGRIEGCSWFQDRVQDMDGWLHFVCPETGSWLRLTIIFRKFRGHGAAPRILAYVFPDLGHAGYKHVFASMDALNRNSIRAAEKSGMRPLLRIYILRLLGLAVVCVGGKISVGLWGRDKPFEIDVEPFLPPAIRP